MKKINWVKFVLITASLVIAILLGGVTYAHINGVETIISPFLRSIGINSRYEENANKFDEQKTENNVTVKMLDGVLDDVNLILGFQIDNADSLTKLNGEYKINNISINPISTTSQKISNTSYIFYQVFDVSNIKLENKANVNIDVKIRQPNVQLSETISVKNTQDAKTYENTNAKVYEVLDNVNISIISLTKGSYVDVLKIQTDKTNYVGDFFEIYYKILDSKGNEIANYNEESMQYDYRVKTDRLILKTSDSKMTVEVYVKIENETYLRKVAAIPLDLSTFTEKVEITENAKEYKCKDYTFKYKDTWNLIEKLDAGNVGPNSIYLGALELEVSPNASIYVKTVEKNVTLEEYAKQIRYENTKSPSEYYEEILETEMNFKNSKGYQITASITDGETNYIKQDIFTVKNGKVIQVIFFGNEIEYNNLKNDVTQFINSFEV